MNRLMEIINSRAVKLPNLEEEKMTGTMAAAAEAEGPLSTHEISNIPFVKNEEDKTKSWGISTPLLQSVVSVTILCFFGLGHNERIFLNMLTFGHQCEFCV